MKNSNLLNFLISLVKTPSLPGQEEKVAKIIFSEMENLDYDEVFTDELGSVIGIIYSWGKKDSNHRVWHWR